MTFPSQFMLVAALNLTPDGKMPGESRGSPREIQNYLNRVSPKSPRQLHQRTVSSESSGLLSSIEKLFRLAPARESEETMKTIRAIVVFLVKSACLAAN